MEEGAHEGKKKKPTAYESPTVVLGALSRTAKLAKHCTALGGAAPLGAFPLKSKLCREEGKAFVW